MLPVHLDAIRVFLHVLAATVWVGGQFTLAALVPVLRSAGRDLTRAVARRFNTLAWSAFAVLIATGAWNIVAERARIHGAYEVTLVVKVTVVLISGAAAWFHAKSRTPRGLAVSGALTALSAVAALLIGVVLAG